MAGVNESNRAMRPLAPSESASARVGAISPALSLNSEVKLQRHDLSDVAEMPVRGEDGCVGAKRHGSDEAVHCSARLESGIATLAIDGSC